MGEALIKLIATFPQPIQIGIVCVMLAAGLYVLITLMNRTVKYGKFEMIKPRKRSKSTSSSTPRKRSRKK
jgi:hypothetical protein